MLAGKGFRCSGGEHAQQVIGPPGGAEQQEEPRALQVTDGGQFAQQAVLPDWVGARRLACMETYARVAP